MEDSGGDSGVKLGWHTRGTFQDTPAWGPAWIRHRSGMDSGVDSGGGFENFDFFYVFFNGLGGTPGAHPKRAGHMPRHPVPVCFRKQG